MRFLKRNIREDGKGLYLFYGSFRLRPLNPRNTKFNLDDEVALAHGAKEYHLENAARVFQNMDYYEIWARRTLRK